MKAKDKKNLKLSKYPRTDLNRYALSRALGLKPSVSANFTTRAYFTFKLSPRNRTRTCTPSLARASEARMSTNSITRGNCAGKKTRTSTPFKAPGPQPGSSTNFDIPALWEQRESNSLPCRLSALQADAHHCSITPIRGECRHRTLRFLAPPDFKSGCPPMDGTHLSAETARFELADHLTATFGLANRCNKPLCHASVCNFRQQRHFTAVCYFWVNDGT